MAAFIDRLTPAPGSFVAEAVLVHDIPGRLRLVAPFLKSNPERAAMLCARLNRANPVRAVSFNTLTGSIVVAYDTRTGSREAVLRALKRAGCRVVLRKSRVSAPAAAVAELPAARAALKAVLHCVLDLAVESAIMAVI